MRKGVVITVVSVVAVIAFGLVGWFTMQPQAQDSQAAKTTLQDNLVQVTASEAEILESKESVRVSGSVRPRRDVTIVSKVGGTVEWIAGEVGTAVQKGDTVLRIDDYDLKLQLREASAMLEQAEAALARMKRGASDEERRQGKASVEQARSSFQLAEESLNRAQYLYNEGVIPKETLDSAKSQYNVAKAQLESAEQMFLQVERGAEPEDIRSAEAQVRQAEIAVEFAERQLNDATMTAPIDGLIAVRHVKEGEMIGSGSPAVTIVYMDKMEVQVGVSDRHVNALRQGDTVVIDVEALPEEQFTGEVIAVSPVVDPETQLYPVQIEVNNPDHVLKPGMAVRASVNTGQMKSVTVVPQRAIVYRNDEPIVFVVGTEGRAQLRRVILGKQYDERIEVDGVQAGERVVTSRHAFLDNGTPVRVEQGAY